MRGRRAGEPIIAEEVTREVDWTRQANYFRHRDPPPHNLSEFLIFGYTTNASQ